MKITVENLKGLERKFNIVIPSERVESEFQTKLHELSSKAKIPGFRPGKVPLAMVEKHYGNSARTSVIDSLIREAYIEGVKQKKLNPVSMPQIEIISSSPKKPLEFNATFEIYPEINLTDASQIQLEKIVSKLTEDDVNEMLEKLRKQKVEWKEITESSRKSQAGDQLTVDFTIKNLDDPNAKTKKEENVKFVLGDGSMWDDFESKLYRAYASEKKKFTLHFPKTHLDQELANKNVEFEVEIHKVCEPVLPPLDDEFAKKMNIKEGGLKVLKTEVRKTMERELQMVLKNLFKKAIMDKLLDNNPIEVPKILVESELDRLNKRWQENFASEQKTTKNTPEFPRKDFEKQALRQVSLGLLLATIIKENKIEISQQELRAKVEELASAYGDTKKVTDWYYAHEHHLAEIKSFLLEEKIIDYIASKAKIVEKELAYKDVITKKEEHT